MFEDTIYYPQDPLNHRWRLQWGTIWKNASTGTSEGARNVVGDGVAGTPVLVVEGGKLMSHGGSGSWLSLKVDIELPSPITSLYTIDANPLPSTADWLCQSWSSNGLSGWSSPFGIPTELHLVIHVFLGYLSMRKHFHTLPYCITS